MERRKFLENTCPTVTFAFFGISFIQACSKSDDSISSYTSNTNNISSQTNTTNTSTTNTSGSTSSGSTSSGSSGSSGNGIVVSGNSVALDLTNSTFNNLNNPGDFVNLTSVGMLVLKISDTQFRAFDNCCPHNGSKDSWSYSNEQFICASHGNSFSIDGNDVKDCNSGATSGGLKRYNATLSGDTLTVTTS